MARPAPDGAERPQAQGRERDRILRETPKTGECTLIDNPLGDNPAIRLNDGKVDRRGRLISGSMDTMESGPNGSLYRLDPDFKVTKLDGGIIVSKGPCWSPDDKIFYVADSWSGDIWAYDYIHGLWIRGVPEPRFGA